MGEDGKRVVVIATLVRGALAVPEPLDESGQAQAFWRLREDDSQSVQAVIDAAMLDARVVWREEKRPADHGARIDKMLKLAERASKGRAA